ncbi:MAG: mevalonate kinase [Nanoarchaeota archaeon]|nr:mevalonate kinase [Nanoarchaeota archaeon]MBU4300105.1 mevalonate kinase [Nanoarchaeota archaeon]MBU4452307.1 mevalonate kinase [Nanoarchaeota archaeon]MCG2723833.1 mevalonate kinase [archaeon]
MNGNTIKASAPGNLFFFGEHAAVYGRPAICAAVDRRTYVELAERNDSKILVYSDSFGSGSAQISETGLSNKSFKAPELSTTFDFIDMLAAKFKMARGFELKIRSEVPVNSGMSSSTALLSAIFKAVSGFEGQNIPAEKYFDYLYPIQVKVHGGHASGSEIISSALGGFNKVHKIEAESKTNLKFKHLGVHKFSIIVGNTKVSSPTSLTVGYHIPSLIARNKTFVFSVFDKIAAISEKAEALLTKNDEAKLGKLINKNQELLSSLGLSHPKLDDCIDEARKAGALGAKLSGSGWGGIMFALTKREDAEKVLRAIQTTGADAFKTEVGGSGVL